MPPMAHPTAMPAGAGLKPVVVFVVEVNVRVAVKVIVGVEVEIEAGIELMKLPVVVAIILEL
jgi:hypothetical protein